MSFRNRKWPGRVRFRSPIGRKHRPAIRLESLESRDVPTTYTVTTTADSGAGSLRQAILDANAHSGADTIAFSIGSGVQTIAPTSRLPSVTDSVVINGRTQPGYVDKPLIVLSGANMSSGIGLILDTGTSTVQGLAVNRFTNVGISLVGGFRHVIRGNFIGTGPSGTERSLGNGEGIAVVGGSGHVIGGTGSGDGNVISGNTGIGVEIVAEANTLEGNRIGIDVTGSVALGNGSYGVKFWNGNDIQFIGLNTIGGDTPAARNVISGNGDSGIYFDDYYTYGHNTIQGNYLGTDVNGQAAVPNAGYGIQIESGSSDLVLSNLVSGNKKGGILLHESDGSVGVRGNDVGTNFAVSGGIPNLGPGVWIDWSKSSGVGGTGVGDGNVIAYNAGAGVAITTIDTYSANAVLGNSIYSNTGPGIDLGNDGVTPNDPLDLDTGPNWLQNYPVIGSVNTDASGTTVVGTLDSLASTTFRIEFFANDDADDPSSYGEGKTFLGANTVTTDASGHASFSWTFSPAFPAGAFITATATNSGRYQTSEFSRAVPNGAVVRLAGGVLSYTDNGHDNDLAVDLVTVDGADYVRFTERHAGGSLVATGDAIADSPTVVRAPASGLSKLVLQLRDGDDRLELPLDSRLPAAESTDLGGGVDQLTLVGTPGDDTPLLSGTGVSWSGKTLTLVGAEDLKVDLRGAGQDVASIQQGFSGASGVGFVGDGDGLVVAATGSLAQAVTLDGQQVTVRRESTGALTLFQQQKVVGPTAIALSPDGRNAYMTAGSTLTEYQVDATTGQLWKLRALAYNGDGPRVDGLSSAADVVVSPDGKNVYVAGSYDGTLVSLSRDGSTGFLSPMGVIEDGTNGADGLKGAVSLAVSPDGKNVYVAGKGDNALAVFTRDADTGSLTFSQVLRNGLVQGDHIVAGIKGIRKVAVSPDGKDVFALSDEYALAAFRRDAGTGRLTVSAVFRNSVGGVTGLFDPNGLAVSPDGRKVYVGRTTAFVSPDGRDLYSADNQVNPVSVFDRDPSSGSLVFKGGALSQIVTPGIDLTFSADGRFAYILTVGYPTSNDLLSVYQRDVGTTLSAGYSGMNSVEVDTASGDDTFAVTPSADTAFVLKGGSQPNADVLHYDGTGLSASDSGTQIVAAGVKPVSYSQIESVTLDNGSPDLTPPVADIVDITPGFRPSGVNQATVTFSEAVTGLDVADFTLLRGVTNVALTGASLSTTDNVTWTLGNLAGLNSTAATYTLRLNANGSGVRDLAKNPLRSDAREIWTVDLTAPTADVVDVTPDPRNVSVGTIDITFSEPVRNLDLADLSLTRNGGSNLLTSDQTVVTSDYRTWTVTNLGTLTSPDGSYRLTLKAAGSGITDVAGNALAADAFDAWMMDATALTGGIVEVQPDPRDTMPTVAINFSKGVTGLDTGDLLLTRDGAAIPLGGTTLTSSDQKNWSLGNFPASRGIGLLQVQKDTVWPNKLNSVILSSDGKFAYAAELQRNTIVVFGRDAATGHLTRLQIVKNGVDGIDGIVVARGLSISPDGRTLYAGGSLEASSTSGTVAVFDRDPQTGLLTEVQIVVNGSGGVTGIKSPSFISVSPDGTSVYVSGPTENTLVAFARDPETGHLTYVETLTDGVGGVDGLANALSVQIALGGDFVYVAGEADDAIAIFSRDGSTGRLNYTGMVKNGVDGVTSMDAVANLTLSPDGQFLYATAINSQSVVVFSRDSSAGTLTFVQAMTNGSGGITNMSSPATPIATDSSLYLAGGGGSFVFTFSRDPSTGMLGYQQQVQSGSSGGGLALSSDGANVYGIGPYADSVAVLKRNASTGLLTASEVFHDWSGVTDGLNGVRGVAVSPDGTSLYAAGAGENALAVFHRDPATGSLTFQQVFVNGIGGVSGLFAAYSVSVSPDGKSVYVASFGDFFNASKVSVFSRDLTTGALTFQQALTQGSGGVDGIASANTISVAPDGKNVYVTGTNTLAVFSRNTTSGQLAFVEFFKDGVNGVDGLSSATSVTVAPDGQTVYAAGTSDVAVTVWARNTTTGRLTYTQMLKDGVGGVDGLGSVTAVTVSPDGKSVYATGSSDKAVAVFQRDAATGQLTFQQVYKDGTGGISGLSGATGVVVAPDGRQLWVTSNSSKALVAFRRDPATGLLTYTATAVDGVNGMDGLNNAYGLAVSPDGRNVYTAGTGDNGIGNFRTFTDIPDGTYTLSLKSDRSGIKDSAGNFLAQDSSDTWTVETHPTADIADVSPDPRNSAVSSVAISFSEPVTGFDLGDLTLTIDGGELSLAGAQLGTSDGTWTLSNLDSITRAPGTYTLTLVAAGSGITGEAGRQIAVDASDSWVTDITPPSVVDVVDVSPDPRNTAVSSVDVVFSEPVNLATFDFNDLQLTRDGGAVSLSSSVAISLVHDTTYRIAGLAGFTTAEGDYTLTVVADGLRDLAGNPGLGSDSDSWIADKTAPPAPPITSITDDTGASSGDGITSDQTLVFTGTAEANSTVILYRGSSSVGTVAAGSDGAWFFDYTSVALPEGSYTFQATATDAAGNVSAKSAAFAVVVDRTVAAPAFAGISQDTGASDHDQVTSDRTLVLSGTAEAGSSVEVFRDGTSIGTATTNGSGAWSFDYTAVALPAGTYSFRARATDLAGNVSSDSAVFAVQVDPDAPAAPSVTAISEDTGAGPADGVTSDRTLVLFGTAEANSRVTLYRAGSAIGQADADSAGKWTFSYEGTQLAEGTYSFTARATDLAGNTSPESAGYTVLVDVTAPAKPVVSGIADDTGASSGDGVTSDPRLVVRGTAEANAAVRVFLDGQPVGSTAADAGGSWTFDYTGTALADGGHAFSARATDLAGNVSNFSADFSVRIDTQAPAVPQVGSVSTDTGRSVTDGVTSDRTLVLSGTAEPNAVITLLRDGSALGTAPVDAAGRWNFDSTGTSLADGSYTFTAFAADLAGNRSSESAGFDVVIDAQSPAAPAITGISDDTGVAADDFLTRDPTLSLSGTAEPDSTVAVYRGGNFLGTTAADVNGEWTFADPATLDEGAYLYTARATDAAGNVGADSATRLVTVDLSTPTPSIDAVVPDTGDDTADGITADPRPRLAGRAEPGSRVALYRDGGSVGTVLADSSGNWVYDSGPDGWADALYRFTAIATDPAGNESAASAEFTVVVDTAAPAAPEVTAVSTDTGDSTTDGLTSDSTLVILGTAEPGSLVRLYRDGAAVGDVAADAQGRWSVDTTATPLADGDYQFTARAADVSGNLSPESAPFAVTVDTRVPLPPIILSANTDTGVDAADRVTNDRTLVLSGTAEPASRVTVFADGQPIGTADAGADGRWVLDHSATELPAGSHLFTALATDRAGNAGPKSSPYSLLIDVDSPTVNIIPVSPDPRSLSVTSVDIVFSEPVFGLDLADLQLSRDGGANLLTGSQTLTTSDQLTWTVGNLDAATLPLGTYTLRLAAAGSDVTDRAGNPLAADASESWAMVNIAPVLMPGHSLPLAPIPRNLATPPGIPVATFVADGISDADGNALAGIAVTGLTQTAHGSWQYSLDGGAHWLDFGDTSDGLARLLRPDDLVRFVPAAGFVGTARLTYRAWDQTAGAAGGTADLTAGTGGTAAFSVDADSTSVKVATTLATVPEDAKAPKGDAVGGLFGSFIADADAGSRRGVAVVGVDADHGTWQFSLNGGHTWRGLTGNPAAAVLLRDTDRLRFLPASNFNGYAEFDFRAWDQTLGAAGGTADLSAAGAVGGATPFSAERDLAFAAVAPVNDAPVLDTVGEPPLTRVAVGDRDPAGDLVRDLLGTTATDAEGDRLGIAVTGATGNGKWQYLIAGAAGWRDVGKPGGKSPLKLDADARVRFVPDGSAAGTATLKYRAWDGAAVSKATETAHLLVTDVAAPPANHAPGLDPDGTPAFTPVNEDAKSPKGDLVRSLLGSVTDPDAPARGGIAVTGLSGSAFGSWQFSTNGGRSWKPVVAASESFALLLRDADRLRFVPNKDRSGPAGVTFRAWDQTRGAAGARADLTVAGGIGGASPFSTGSESASLVVRPVDDPPEVKKSTLSLTSVRQSDPDPAGDAVAALIARAGVDAEGDALSLAVSAPKGVGRWEYQPQGQGAWQPITAGPLPTVLTAGDRLRFAPDIVFAGTASLTFRLRDGASASLRAGTLRVSVSAARTPPALDPAAVRPMAAVSVNDSDPAGDRVGDLLGPSVTDPEPNAAVGIAISGADQTHGVWQVRVDGAAWEDLGFVSADVLRRLKAGDRVRFVPAPGFTGAARLTFRAWDAAAADPFGPGALSKLSATTSVSVNTAPELLV